MPDNNGLPEEWVVTALFRVRSQATAEVLARMLSDNLLGCEYAVPVKAAEYDAAQKMSEAEIDERGAAMLSVSESE